MDYLDQLYSDNLNFDVARLESRVKALEAVLTSLLEAVEADSYLMGYYDALVKFDTLVEAYSLLGLEMPTTPSKYTSKKGLPASFTIPALDMLDCNSVQLAQVVRFIIRNPMYTRIFNTEPGL